MITKEVFDRVQETYDKIKHKVTRHDILSALTEELGEYSRAARIEDSLPSDRGKKKPDEPSKVEAIDLMLCGIEAYIAAGGTWEELPFITNKKLSKWEQSWET